MKLKRVKQQLIINLSNTTIINPLLKVKTKFIESLVKKYFIYHMEIK